MTRTMMLGAAALLCLAPDAGRAQISAFTYGPTTSFYEDGNFLGSASTYGPVTTYTPAPSMPDFSTPRLGILGPSSWYTTLPPGPSYTPGPIYAPNTLQDLGAASAAAAAAWCYNRGTC